MLSELKRFRFVSWILITLLLWHYGGGLTYAQNRERAKVNPRTPTVARGAAPPAVHEDLQFDVVLSELKETLGAKETRPQEGQVTSAMKAPVDLGKLGDLKARLVQENDKVQAYFSELETFIKQKGLSEEILNRHWEFVREYEAKYATLMTNLGGIESAQEAPTGFWASTVHRLRQAMTGEVNREEVVTQTLSFLEANTSQPRKSHFDPHNLPHRSLKADKPIPPKLTPEEWRKAFPQEAGETGAVSSLLSVSTAEAAPTPAPTPADLAETIEVQFTPEIRNLAESLDNNPVKIFNWVRNNIEFVPIWGSIQGAQLCMETKSCNAFDTASLLIALFRVAGIPARYQMGTIEVPIDQFMNWAGGFTNADAAASLFASGGVPSVVRRVNQSGQVVSIKLEHVWVKAFVDYAPSGGAVNVQGDNWQEIDPSFKQYHFESPADLSAFSNIGDPNQLLSDVFPANSISTDGSEVFAMNQALLEQRMTPDSDGGLAFLQNAFPHFTLRQVAGGPAITPQVYDILPASLPYRILSRASGFTSIPDALRHRVTFELLSPDGNASLSYSRFLSEIGASNLVLGYNAASAVDAQFLANLLPTNEAIPFPETWPVFTLKVKPIFKVEGTVVAEGPAVGFLSQQRYRIHFSAPTIQTGDVLNDILAGETQVIALDLQRPAPGLFANIRARLRAQSDRLTDGDWRQISFTDLGELNMGAIAATWFAEIDMTVDMASNHFGVVTHRYPSAAVVFADWRVSSLFGSPVSGATVGFAMDIDRDIVVSISRDGNTQKSAGVNFLAGMFGSQLEATAPAQYMWTEADPSLWIAADGVLSIALANGVTLARLDSANIATLRPKLSLPADILQDIEDAVASGRKVLIHERTMRDGTGPVVSYVALDPNTGSGAYIIQGGTGGSQILDDIRERYPTFEPMLTRAFGWAWDQAKEYAIQEAMNYVLGKLNLSGLGDLIERAKGFKEALDTLLEFVQNTQHKIDFYNQEVAIHGPSVRPLAGILIIVGAMELVSQFVDGPLGESIAAYGSMVAVTALRGYESEMKSLARTREGLLLARVDPETLETF